MRTRQPRFIVATSDLALARLVDEAIPVPGLEWCGSFSAALARLTPATEVLVVDASLDAPMARLLATLFVDRQPGRRAFVVRSPGQSLLHAPHDRVTILDRPRTPSDLAALLDDVVDLATEDLDAMLELDAETVAA